MLSLRRSKGEGIVISDKNGEIVMTIFKGAQDKLHIHASQKLRIERAEKYMSEKFNRNVDDYKNLSINDSVNLRNSLALEIKE